VAGVLGYGILSPPTYRGTVGRGLGCIDPTSWSDNEIMSTMQTKGRVYSKSVWGSTLALHMLP